MTVKHFPTFLITDNFFSMGTTRCKKIFYKLQLIQRMSPAALENKNLLKCFGNKTKQRTSSWI